MGKPWARYEVGFIGHDKFRAIPGNAICLWLEGKNYADAHSTDGLLPAYEVKHWRFYSKKNVDILMRSCGHKPGADHPYAPLWVAHPVGFQMHDYLDHNDCRDAVMARKDKAAKDKAETKRRQAEWRAKRKTEREEATRNALRHGTGDAPETSPPHNDHHNNLESNALDRIQKTEDRSQKKQEQEREERSLAPRKIQGGGAMAGMLPKDHLDHTACGRVCLLSKQGAEFAGRLGGPLDAALTQVRTWAEGVLDEWDRPPKLSQPIGGSTFQFWQARFIEWQGPAPGAAAIAVDPYKAVTGPMVRG